MGRLKSVTAGGEPARVFGDGEGVDEAVGLVGNFDAETFERDAGLHIRSRAREFAIPHSQFIEIGGNADLLHERPTVFLFYRFFLLRQLYHRLRAARHLHGGMEPLDKAAT
jgi:hypothetical protein